MTMVRVYVPLSAASVAELYALGSMAAPPVSAFAVTPRLVNVMPSTDEEEREYAAFLAAADAASALVVEGGKPRARRVVAAADLAASVVSPHPANGSRHLAAVSVAVPLTTKSLVSFHLDESPSADADLLWYDITELGAVVELLG